MPRLLIIIPTYNEEQGIEKSIDTALTFWRSQRDCQTTIVVADSSDRDRTREIVAKLAAQNPDVGHHEFPDGTGRGEKVRVAAMACPDFDVYASIDSDLPIAMHEFRAIVAAIEQGADVAAASKYVPGGSSSRPLHRVVISKVGNRFFNLFLRIPVHDFLAGAKAWSRSVNAEVLPTILNNQFFFDTELLYRADRAGKRIVEIPVHYVDLRVLTSKVGLGKLGLEFARNTYALLSAERTRPPSS